MIKTKDIPLSNLIKYLEYKKWHKLDFKTDLPVTYWEHDKVAGITLRVPDNKDLADYQLAMQIIFDDLAKAEKRPVGDILSSIGVVQTFR